MKKIIILDFETGEVYVYPYDENITEGYEEYYELLNEKFDTNFSDSNCQCMIVDDLIINIH